LRYFATSFGVIISDIWSPLLITKNLASFLICFTKYYMLCQQRNVFVWRFFKNSFFNMEKQGI
jgi:hypothetical protein